MFCSYNFEDDTTPADVDPETLYKEFPSLCAGIVLFDILLINPDRHAGNIKVDNPAKPTGVHIFDHEGALLYIYPNEGKKRLAKKKNRFGISDSIGSADEWHCLIE